MVAARTWSLPRPEVEGLSDFNQWGWSFTIGMILAILIWNILDKLEGPL